VRTIWEYGCRNSVRRCSRKHEKTTFEDSTLTTGFIAYDESHKERATESLSEPGPFWGLDVAIHLSCETHECFANAHAVSCSSHRSK